MSGRCYRQRSSRACELPFTLDEGGHSKGSAKIVMLRGRTDALRWRLNRTGIAQTRCSNLSRPVGQLSPLSTGGGLPNKDRPEAVSFLLLGDSPCLGRVIALAALVARERAALTVSTVNQALSCRDWYFPFAFRPRCENELRTAEYSVRPSLPFWRHFPFAFPFAF
jgi:hypothetical protein